MPWSVADIAVIALIGLMGGTLGGLLGLGGSVFIIPALTLFLGTNQHLYQAAALIANVFVACAATWKHRGRGTIRRDVVPIMATATSLAAIAGVLVSNLIPPLRMTALFGVFLLYSVVREIESLLRRKSDPPEADSPRCSPRLAAATGTIGGFASGLLGIGGGAIMVPILRGVGRLPLRHAVASSAAAMIVACAIGACTKNATIGGLVSASGEALTLRESLSLAAALAPTAMVGGMLGASLVYRLPVTATRVVLTACLAFAGVRMILTGLGK